MLAAAIAATACGAVAVTRHKHRLHEAALQTLRRDGLAASAAADWPAAAVALDRYVAEHDDDDDALLACAVARSNVEAPGDASLRGAVRRLDQLLARPGGVTPARVAARRTLIELLVPTTDTARLDELTDDALAADPADVVALRARVSVRLRQGRVDDALTAARAVAVAVPVDVPARLTVLRLIRRLARPAAEAEAFADAQFPAADSRAALLRSAVLADAGRTDDALTALRPAAASLVPSDPSLVGLFADAFDGLARFDEATALLDAAARASGDVRLTRSLALRLWQRGHGDRVLSGPPGGTADGRPADTAGDATVLAVRAIAACDAGRNAEARRIVAALGRRADRAARAWAVALPAKLAPPTAAGAAPAAAFEKALAIDGDNGVVRAWLAAAYAAAGEPALALRQWNAAADACPSWAWPQAGRARALAAIGCDADAVAAAQAAYDRAPGLSAAVDLIDARFARYDHATDAAATGGAAADDLLAATAAVLARRPLEARTLAVRAAVLCRLGRRDEAAAALEPAVPRAARFDAAGLSRLVAVAREEGLVADDAWPTATPAADARAAADEHADSIDAQRAALDAQFDAPVDARRGAPPTPAGGFDAAFVDRAVDRLHALTGDAGQQWRLYRALSLTAVRGGKPASPESVAEAVTLLSDLVRETPRQVRPRVALARALRLGGNPGSAIEHLRLARAVDPHAPGVLAALVSLLRETRRDDEAASLLRREAAGPALPPRTALVVAALCLDGADPATALALLSRPDAPPAGRPLCVVAARQAVAAARAAGRWDAVRAAAAQWKRADPGDAVAADTAVAEADLAAGRVEAAGATLSPHLAAVRADPAAAPQSAVVLARVAFASGRPLDARLLLRPLLGRPAGRAAIRALAIADASTLADAAACLSDADAAGPGGPDAVAGENVAAAAAWAAVGRRFGDPATLRIALARAGACSAARPGDDAAALLRAGLLQQLGRTDAAAAALRSLLDRVPLHPAANNDLACLLLDAGVGPAGGDLAEAGRRAATAVAASPNDAAFRDTLDRVRRAVREATARASASE